MKLCFISDTHNNLHRIIEKIPKCDYLIHCGDLTNLGTITEIKMFNNDLEAIRKKNIIKNDIIVIAGNHDLLLEKDTEIGKKIITNAVYLHDESIILENGMKLHGSPVTPKYYNWAFMIERGKPIKDFWYKTIPDDTDILVTHGPPYKILDRNRIGKHCGCNDLLDRIKDLKNLKINAFGHIHEDSGSIFIDGVHYINAVSLNKQTDTVNDPIILDI